MEKIWYLFIDGKQEGPYSVEELRRDPRLTFETYAWRVGMAEWKKIGDLPELRGVLGGDEGDGSKSEPEPAVGGLKPQRDELAIDLGGGPPPVLLWIIFLILVLIYFILTL